MHVSGDVLLEASGTANVTPMSRKCRDEQRSRDLGWRERVEKQRRRGRCKAKCNTTIKKKVATAETEREGTKRKKNKRKQVCGGPTSNPASALGFRNRGVISVKTHSQPAYCLNEATFAPPTTTKKPFSLLIHHLLSNHTHKMEKDLEAIYCPLLRIALHGYLSIVLHYRPPK